jgi:NADH-quinone oxidoreductase subunit L
MICTVIAVAALAGLPPLSGFFSKEVILAALADLNNPIWLAAGLLGAFLTAYYAFRLIFIIIFPKELETNLNADHEHDHGQDTYWLMAWPLIILAAVTVLLGFFQGVLEEFFKGLKFMHDAKVGHHAGLPFVALGASAIGLVLAWMEFGRRDAGQIGFIEKIVPLNNLFSERWYIDHFYRRFLDVVIYGGISNLCTKNDDKVIDGGIDGLSRGTIESGRFVSFLNLGMIQYRLLAIFVVIILLVLYFFF